MPTADPQFEDRFRAAVAAIDAGDLSLLQSLLRAEPRLACERLREPGEWLRAEVGGALDGFFRDPYLLWFTTEDPVRKSTLPANVVAVALAIIDAARSANSVNLQEQLDYALRLVCWSWIARDCGVQIGLIDAFLDADADVDGWNVYDGRYGSHADSAIYNRNFDAARRLLARGAECTLTVAACLERWDDFDRLVPVAAEEELQDAFVQAALNGNTAALRRMLAKGVPPTTTSQRNQSHGTALHHAVWSCNLEAVKVLIEAGADRTARDTAYDDTPQGWAEYAASGEKNPERAAQYRAIAAYLQSQDKAST